MLQRARDWLLWQLAIMEDCFTALGAWLRRWDVSLYWEPRDLWIGLFWDYHRPCELGKRCRWEDASHADYPLEVLLYVIILPTWPLRLRYREPRLTGYYYSHRPEG